jgi:hypothetical protein
VRCLLACFLALTACVPVDPADSDTGGHAPIALACNPPISGTYIESGTCFLDHQGDEVTLVGSGCEFLLKDWPDRYDQPDGGTIRDGTVMLSPAWDAKRHWEECPGAMDGYAMAGSCAFDGCEWRLDFEHS